MRTASDGTGLLAFLLALIFAVPVAAADRPYAGTILAVPEGAMAQVQRGQGRYYEIHAGNSLWDGDCIRLIARAPQAALTIHPDEGHDYPVAAGGGACTVIHALATRPSLLMRGLAGLAELFLPAGPGGENPATHRGAAPVVMGVPRDGSEAIVHAGRRALYLHWRGEPAVMNITVRGPAFGPLDRSVRDHKSGVTLAPLDLTPGSWRIEFSRPGDISPTVLRLRVEPTPAAAPGALNAALAEGLTLGERDPEHRLMFEWMQDLVSSLPPDQRPAFVAGLTE